MLSLAVYKTLHLLGAFYLFMGLGTFCALRALQSDEKAVRKMAAAAHGIGLAFLLVAGFGMLARLGGGFPMWLVAKLVLWLFLGAAPVLIKRSRSTAQLFYLLPLIGLAAAALALYKPF